MVTHEEMVEAFGDDGLLLMDAGQCAEMGLSEADAHVLCQVGLPVRADHAFTTAVSDEPRTGSLVVFKTGSGEVDVLILGGTPGGAGTRYFLDIRSGVVGLLSLDGEPQAERINSSPATFVEFLRRLRLRQQALNGAPEDAGPRCTEELWLSLKELDPDAFRDAEAWWSMVMDDLMDRSPIDEARAFLRQRRAEVGAASSGPGPAPAAEPRRAQRERFDQALGRLTDEGWQIVDAGRFAADTETSGLLSLPADLADHFAPGGALVKDVTISWRGGLPSRIQSVFAREGLVVSVPGQAERDGDPDALLDLDAEELSRQADEAMEALFAAVHGLNRPEEGFVTCVAGGEVSSDLCRVVRAFDRLAEQGYFAEPDLWPTVSGAWQHVHEAGASAKAVFWTTQAHTSCFDARGDLVDELTLQWAGDRDLIAQVLSATGLVVESPQDAGTTFLLRPKRADRDR
ncbi:hypothetical protein E1292_36740 [Nonomuraea deserti]|uniref:Uncharacterized protein n=1 Tax=Nonomuraea deserti TaxID=1848322 RepID=A0A4R4UXZ7_9ACTN|nr:SUKH-4 family immunity protein [Nonomuraea deserti]TDC97568.1 hypothetical protein E1292_36740 [Nonomuraea deserti]